MTARQEYTEELVFSPGEKVRIVLGLLDGRIAKVVRRAPWDWARAIPQYVLDVDGISVERTIRADFLRRIP